MSFTPAPVAAATSVPVAAPTTRTPLSCPLNDGVAVVDQLLAAVTSENDAAALDAALDFRLLLARTQEPDPVLAEFYRLRSTVEERHYLALYRLRRWLEARYVAQVQLSRTEEPRRVGLRLHGRDLAELRSRCVAIAAASEPVPPMARVRFANAAPLAVSGPR